MIGTRTLAGMTAAAEEEAGVIVSAARAVVPTENANGLHIPAPITKNATINTTYLFRIFIDYTQNIARNSTKSTP